MWLLSWVRVTVLKKTAIMMSKVCLKQTFHKSCMTSQTKIANRPITWLVESLTATIDFRRLFETLHSAKCKCSHSHMFHNNNCGGLGLFNVGQRWCCWCCFQESAEQTGNHRAPAETDNWCYVDCQYHVLSNHSSAFYILNYCHYRRFVASQIWLST